MLGTVQRSPGLLGKLPAFRQVAIGREPRLLKVVGEVLGEVGHAVFGGSLRLGKTGALPVADRCALLVTLGANPDRSGRQTAVNPWL